MVVMIMVTTKTLRISIAALSIPEEKKSLTRTIHGIVQLVRIMFKLRRR